MKERIITFFTLLLLLCVPFKMQGQGTKLGEKFLKGLSYKRLSPIATKPGKPFTIQRQMKLIDSEWEKIKKKDNHLSSEIDINRRIKSGTTFLVRLKPLNGASLYFDNPVQSVVMRGDEIETFTECRLLKPLPPGMTGFQIEEELWAEGDSVPFAKDYIDIEIDEQNPLFEDDIDMDVSNTTHIKVQASDVTPVEENAVKRKSNYTVKSLFHEEGETIKWKNAFMSFLEKEKYLSDSIFHSNRRDDIAMSFVSFYKRLRVMRKVPAIEAVNGPACYRFLTIDCGLKCNEDKDYFGDFIHRVINPKPQKYKGSERVRDSIDKKVEDWFCSQGLYEQ